MKPFQQYFHMVLFIQYVFLTLSLWVKSYSVAIQMKTSSLCFPFFFFFKNDIGVPNSQTINSSCHSTNLRQNRHFIHPHCKTCYSKKVFLKFQLLNSQPVIFILFDCLSLNKFSISATVLLLSVHLSVCLSVCPSIQFAGCVQRQFLRLVWFGHEQIQFFHHNIMIQ